MSEEFDRLVAEGLSTPFEGWDFGVFEGRYQEGDEPWSYAAIVRERMASAGAMLDMGTGGGEFLASLGALPEWTVATEGYAPNVPVARARLAPLGVEVVEVGEDDVLKFPDSVFDLVINRHESFDPGEVGRVLKPGGVFVTQQVGGWDVEEVNAALGGPEHAYRGWDLAEAVTEVSGAGLEVEWSEEARVPGRFLDVGALVLFLRITEWQVPGFSVEGYRERLRGVRMPLEVHAHRFALVARRPA
ncbi:methyltransferase domain-containing protein [Nonomuraea sp. NPDC050310]|uniref:class I SAM-dependent methyltransferase n=1 Tax=Nonomuraea sp. NPDC050310 TaxID=3154935 RepID=UPI0033D9C799